MITRVEAHQYRCLKYISQPTDIVIGSQHPRLRDWKGQVDLGTLYASGVLG